MTLGLTQRSSFQTSVTCVPCCIKNSCCNINDLPNVLYVTFLPFTHTETVQLAYGLSGTSSIGFPGVGPIPLIKKNVLVNGIFYDPNNFPTSNIPVAIDPGYQAPQASYVFEYVDPDLAGQGDRNGGPFTFEVSSLKRWDYQLVEVQQGILSVMAYAGPEGFSTTYIPYGYEDPYAIPQANYTRTIKAVRLYCCPSNEGNFINILQWQTQASDALTNFFGTNIALGKIHPNGNKVLSSCTPFFGSATGTRWHGLHKLSAELFQPSSLDFIDYYKFQIYYPPQHGGSLISTSYYRTWFSGNWEAIITE